MSGLLPLTWVANTSNRKTGRIPTAYVGSTVEECRKSCKGCALLGNGCYAWGGFAKASLGRIEKRREQRPDLYTIESALARRLRSARIVRIGAMGDPARADRSVLRLAVERVRGEGLGVVSYTHFWRDEGSDLADLCLASCNDPDEGAEAIAAGFVPAVLLPWDHYETSGSAFWLSDGTRGLVCPAQTKPSVQCNTCGLCDRSHSVWKAGTIGAIGFLDHSRKANAEKRRRAKRLAVVS